ncbi:MAG TPA: arginine--tRNA ligase [Gemmataceae bacterium]|nr:arginine--tRNA ligase [Gemmataceae bacterium]
MNVLALLQRKLQDALTGLVDDSAPYAAMLKPAQDVRFGDYQANCAMPLAKRLDKKPPEIAKAIVERLQLEDMLAPPAIAGPGFINLTLQNDWLARQVRDMASSDRLGVAPVEAPHTFVVDFSSPNVAKPMHVGHLRSTIIGDALARLLRFLGHKVVTDNHLGDWGTQFGMLLYGYKHFRKEAALADNPVREMVRLYVEVRKLIAPAEDVEDEPEHAKSYAPQVLVESRTVLEAVRQETAKLHAGDSENVQLWQRFMPWCLAEIEPIYRQLDVRFDQTHGESYYNPVLPDVVGDLIQKGVAQELNGMVAIPSPFAEDHPPLVRKKDGAFTYLTTDLATIRERIQGWQPDEILYVVDFRQALHFKILFDAARRWKYDKTKLAHISFGSVLGSDRKPIKTREGGAVELCALLHEAIAHATHRYQETRRERLERGEEVPDLTPEELDQIYQAVGYGAVKYADLSQNRESDYIFSWDKMLSTEGNTATYMQYAYVRNRGIFRKGNVDVLSLRQNPPPVMLPTPEERALALQLLRFQDALTAAAAEYKPSLITAYLWDLAKTYSGFFQNCPVLKAETAELRQSRLLLCDLTARVIQRGLDLLGIRTVERM